MGAFALALTDDGGDLGGDGAVDLGGLAEDAGVDALTGDGGVADDGGGQGGHGGSRK